MEKGKDYATPNIGRGIRKVRKMMGFTQMELAKKAKVTQWYISSIENNGYNPTNDMLSKLCNAMEVPVIYIFWKAIEREDVPDSKKSTWTLLNQSVSDIFKEIFEEEEVFVEKYCLECGELTGEKHKFWCVEKK